MSCQRVVWATTPGQSQRVAQAQLMVQLIELDNHGASDARSKPVTYRSQQGRKNQRTDAQRWPPGQRCELLTCQGPKLSATRRAARHRICHRACPDSWLIRVRVLRRSVTASGRRDSHNIRGALHPGQGSRGSKSRVAGADERTSAPSGCPPCSLRHRPAQQCVCLLRGSPPPCTRSLHLPARTSR